MANSFDFFVTIDIGGKTIPLTASNVGAAVSDIQNSLTHGFSASYHAADFDSAISLGTLGSAETDLVALVNGMGTSLGFNTSAIFGSTSGSTTPITDAVKNMVPGSGAFATFVTDVSQVELRVTDLAFNTTAKSFTLGLGFVLGDLLTLTSPIQLGLKSFGFVVTHT
jgi:hypothetical protein